MTTVFDFTTTFISFIEPNTGSWTGSGFNFGSTSITPQVTSLQSGSWSGSSSNFAINAAALENHDKTQKVSDEFPNVNEGINTGEYNVFPLPEQKPKVIQKERDMTRFVKTYSFGRHQPVRLRVIKR